DQHQVDDGLQTLGNVGHFGVVAAGCRAVTDIIRAGQQYNHFWVDAVEFTIFEAPQDVLNGVGAPAEIRRVPTEEVLFPVGEHVRIIRGAPAADDGVAFEVDVDTALARLFQELRVRGQGVLIGAGNGPIRGNRRR